MSKYEPLTSLLASCDADETFLSFNQIADMIDGDLPDSAYNHRPWWANRSDGRGSQNLAWQSIGWETRDVDMSRETVRFLRVRSSAALQKTDIAKGLTIAQAKAGLAQSFGIPIDSIEIHIRG